MLQREREYMPDKAPAIIASILTTLLLIVSTVLLLFSELVALNGFSERVSTIALVTSLGCQSVSGILAVVLAWRLTTLFIIKFNWNKTLAVIISVFAGVSMGGVLSIVSLFISIFIAETIR